MSQELLTSIERFESLLRDNRRYQPEAYNFVYEALDWTLNHIVDGPNEPGTHVGGKELLEGIRRFALEKFGPMACMVFGEWGVNRTDDWGKIVFTLIDYDLMGKQDSDQLEDFSGVYDFEREFNVEPAFEYDPAHDAWNVTYRQRSGLHRN